MASDPISVNGNLYSWGSIVVKVDNEPIYGFKSIAFGDARERVKGYGLGAHHAPIGRTRGKYTIENAKLGGYPHAIQALRERLAARAGGKSYGDVEFQVVTGYFEDDLDPIVVDLSRCVIAKNASSHDESPDPLLEEIELDVMAVRRNDLILYDESQGSPV